MRIENVLKQTLYGKECQIKIKTKVDANSQTIPKNSMKNVCISQLHR